MAPSYEFAARTLEMDFTSGYFSTGRHRHHTLGLTMTIEGLS